MNAFYPEKSGSRTVAKAAAIVACLFISLFSCLSVGDQTTENAGREKDVVALQKMQETFRWIAEEVVPVVVSITVNDIAGAQNPWDYFFQDPEADEDSPQERDFEQYGVGSGIIVDKRQNVYYVLTNYHVIKGGKEIVVALSDSREYKAELVGTDERKDMALLSIKTDEELPVAKLGDSDALRVGDWVIAVGNPYGWRSSVTSGIVSALGRRLDRNANIANISDFIQTDAGINPGNSGGGLVNLQGEIIGINTWITSPTGGSIGIGFAIPINNAKKFVNDMITGGKLQYGWLGVSVARMLTLEAAKELGIEKKQGAFVNYVIKNSPADKGGIFAGDFITVINGKKVIDESHFIQLISELGTSAPVTITVIRLGAEKTLSFNLSPRPSETAISEMAALSWPGFITVPITKEARERYKIALDETGVVVVFIEQGTPGAKAGLHTGDVVKAINKKEIKTMIDFYAALNDLEAKKLEFEIKRAGSAESVTLER